jgi:hypothetical protein
MVTCSHAVLSPADSATQQALQEAAFFSKVVDHFSPENVFFKRSLL